MASNSNLVWMEKDAETIAVNPATVEAHKKLGWKEAARKEKAAAPSKEKPEKAVDKTASTTAEDAPEK
jgi:hypothetical protein